MKILEQKTPEGWEYKATCKQCGSVLLIEPQDVKFGDFGVAYADDHDWQYYFMCPVENCEEIQFIPDNKITNAISKRFDKARRRH